MKRIFLGLALIFLAVGCQTVQSNAKAQPFPETWPQALKTPRSFAVDTPAGPYQGPVIWVDTLKMDLDASNPRSSTAVAANSQTADSQTAKVLTDWWIQELKTQGLQVVQSATPPANADYQLETVVPRLHYAVQGGYPAHIAYSTELACRLSHTKTGTVLLNRSLSNVVEQTALVNTMTKLPREPLAFEQVLLQKGVAPIMKTLAADVKTQLAQAESASSESE